MVKPPIEMIIISFTDKLPVNQLLRKFECRDNLFAWSKRNFSCAQDRAFCPFPNPPPRREQTQTTAEVAACPLALIPHMTNTVATP